MKQPSLLFLLPWLLLSLIEQTLCLPWTYPKCPPSKCGNLRIQHPFYLKSDGPGCSDPLYQLNCEGNKTTLQIFEPEKYIVTSLDSFHLHVVVERFVDGGCTVLTVSPSYSILKESFRVMNWGSLVKCGELVSNNIYLPVRCMSTNDSFVYLVVGYDAYQVRHLEPSCLYLAMLPLNLVLDGSENITVEATELLQYGFTLYFDNKKFNSFIDTLLWFAQFIGEILLTIIVITRVMFMAPTILVFLAYLLIKSKTITDNVEKFLQNQQSLMPTRYAYTDIITITGNFREKLGQGGFGTVFKGVLPGGILVAVKMLGISSCNGDEFINEVGTLGRIHHFNVVRLVGFCAEGSKRALIYEYMPNSSLDKYIFITDGNERGHHTFTLAKLSEIAFGIARGIEYLHRGCDMQILHFDIKPNNILLDANFTPKISDFGLAKLYPKENSIVAVSVARGTIGYMAPELVSRTFGAISHKADVYSFGMLLMEMVGGRRNVDPNMDKSSRVYYPAWVYDELIKQQQNEINDIFDISEVEKKLSLVALWCIQIQSAGRGWLPDQCLLSWTIPPTGWHKLNADGARCVHTNRAAAGGLIRDEYGYCTRAFHRSIGAATVEEAELWGLWDGLKLAWEMGIRQLVVETDNAVIFYTMQSTAGHNVNPGASRLLQLVIELLRRAWWIEIKLISRNINCCADLLAKRALAKPISFQVFNYIPQFLYTLLFTDLNSVPNVSDTIVLND